MSNFPARLLPSLTPPQRNRAELLDLESGNAAETERSLRDIARINRFLGGTAVVERALWPMLGNLSSASILDIGTGSADIPRHLIRKGQEHGIDLTIFAADLVERHLQVARESSTDFPTLLPFGADAFRLPLSDESVDVVTASLFLHHFRPPQIEMLLHEFQRVCRVGFIVNDIVRDYAPLVFFKMTAPIFARSYLTRYDGKASILRAYTAVEMSEIVAKCGVKAQVREHFPYRLSVIHQKSGF